jgi:thiamine transporter ThiT
LDPKLKRTAAIGLFAALALALNFPLLGVPNVELFSVCLFISGVFLGYRGGIITPLIAGIIFVFFNPNGPPSVITMVIAQFIGFILFGLAGAIFGKSILRNKNHMVGMAFCGAIGVVFTFIYDALTNAALGLTFGAFWPTMAGGIAFSLMHFVSNGLIFGFSEPLMVKLWQIVEPRLYPSSSY